ncbi:MAG: NAD(P)H-hydrate dehydratase [Simkaniaceae bacterium]
MKNRCCPKLEGRKVIKASTMKLAEKKSIDEGADDEAYMKQAALGIAAEVERLTKIWKRKKEIVLLIGKGNNGGDAFTAGCYLLDKDYNLRAYCLSPLEDTSFLCQKFGKRFQEKGGSIEVIEETESLCFPCCGWILDGIFGTGFSGKPEGKYAALIAKANESGVPIISIDIPSGLNGDSGEVKGPCIAAFHTIFLGQPKTGFFFGEGYNYIGTLSGVDFGMPPKYMEEIDGLGFLLHEAAVSQLKPKVQRNRHKYQAGYVLTIGGSKGMGGAPIMAAHGALKAGAGMSRLFFPEGMKMDLINSPVEIIKTAWEAGQIDSIYEEAKRAKAAVLGPGLGRGDNAFYILEELLQNLELPLVLDADALFFLAKHPDRQFKQQVILTPHHQEMLRLLGKEGFDQEEEMIAACQKYVEGKGCTLVLKGAPSWVFHPKSKPIIVPRGDPGMATAGSGDVLSGILGAVVAQGLPLREAAVFGVYIHALSGEIAAAKRTSYCLMATDLIDFLPEAFALL